MDDLRHIFESDQFDEQRRIARRHVEAMAGDVITYRAALQDAGITDPLLATLVTQFNRSWVGMDADDVTLDLSMLLEGDE